ncbi:BTAD domain-containing putative transcriptional regulator [Streptomyces sp. NPDC001388]|uniref:AfsR/SARP family transcriptional regulator n=1 Tax=Streptomyces sp. NPDC001388 TaxID=3364568 RepID=UPI0036B9667E
MEFRVLGPVEVWGAGRRLPSFARKPTALLAAGLVDAGRVVPVDRLVDAVWGEDPPATAAKLVQSYVAALRRVLHRPGRAPVIVTRPSGYLFQPEAEKLDLWLFQNLVERSRLERERSRHTAAADTLERALGLWRGPALGGARSPALRVEATRLEEMRTAAAEQLMDARLQAGGGAELVGELTRLVSGHPLRERLRGLLMVALYRAGRRADALAVYRDSSRLLRQELGVEPGRELTELHAQLLAADALGPGSRLPRLTPEPAVVTVTGGLRTPRQLPAAVGCLTGRRAETERLVTALTRTGGGTEEVPGQVCVVHGMGGVGKTALALHVAHRVAASFPDGQLYADLRGADPARSAHPGEVVAEFLRALGVRAEQVPGGLSERTALYRTVLARRRVLVVLDDAAGDRQVQPLLPGSGGSAALVTGRRHLTGLDSSARVGLGALGPRSTVELLGSLVGADRVAAEPSAALDIARLCGGLPLAIRVAGSRLGARGRWPLAGLAARLRDEHRRLDELRTGDLDVRTSIARSYRGLSAPERLAFRRLALLGPVDLAPWLGSPLLGISLAEAERLVEALVEAHLLEMPVPDDTGRIRYRFHELVRLYAEERACAEDSAADRWAAIERAVRLWLTLVRHAAHQEPPPGRASWAPDGDEREWGRPADRQRRLLDRPGPPPPRHTDGFLPSGAALR